MIQRLLPLVPIRATFAFLFAAALAMAPQAQVVIDNFDDGDVSDIGSFGGNPSNDAGAGVGPTDDRDGTADRALNLGVNPGSGDAFAGFSIGAGDGAYFDASSSEYLTFYVRPTLNADNVPVVLEINLQEDGDGDGDFDGNTAPATDDEYQATWRLNVVDGQPYTLVQIPLAAFSDDDSFTGAAGDGDFDFSKIKNVVIAMGGLSGSAFGISFDDFAFQPTAVIVPGEMTVIDNFDDGDVSDIGSFGGNPSNDAGAGVGPTDDRDGTADRALNLGVNPGSGDAFAGFSIGAGDGAYFDASSSEYLTFYVRPTLNADNVPVVLEINLQEDGDGDGDFDGNTAPATDDEYQATWRLNVVDGQPYTLVQIPLAAFSDDDSFTGAAGDGDFDFSKIKNVVIAMGGLSGSAFGISFDDFAFSTGTMDTASEDLPETFAVAPVAFPNPTAGDATVAFGLTSPSMVRAEVYDMLGRRVATLAEGTEPAGEVRLTVPTDALVSGTYIIRIQTDAGAAMTRLTVTR